MFVLSVMASEFWTIIVIIVIWHVFDFPLVNVSVFSLFLFIPLTVSIYVLWEVLYKFGLIGWLKMKQIFNQTNNRVSSKRD